MRHLRVIIDGPQFPDSFQRSISDNLKAMGHEVTCVQSNLSRRPGRIRYALRSHLAKAVPALERASWRRLIRTTRAVHPDLVLTDWYTPPEVVRELKDVCTAKVACWYVDSPMNLGRMYLLACPYDAVFTKETSLVAALREKLGLQAHYLPECCNPLAYRRVALSEQDYTKYGCDLAAMGSMHYWRARMLEVFEGYDLKIWGTNCPPWLVSPARQHYTNRYVAGEAKAKALLAAKIVINIIHLAEIDGVNGALFQIAGCGAFQIADWKPSLPKLFEPEREIVTFRTRQELKEKVDYYLAHPEERREIAGRAYVRAQREHTYEKRLGRIFEVLGLATQAGRNQSGSVESLTESRTEKREMSSLGL